MLRKWRERIRRKLIRKNRIYIMPSGRGVLFLLTVIILILVAATYNNNLIYIQAFLLFSMFVVTMLQTHFNLVGVELEFLNSEECFAGDEMGLLFQLSQKRSQFKRQLTVRSLSKKWPNMKLAKETLGPRDQKKTIRLVVRASQRGVHVVPDIALETYFPLGLFRSWIVFRPAGQVTVYPKPFGHRLLIPQNADAGVEDLGSRTSPEGDFGELKNYLSGESYHQIAWKQFAKSGTLYSKVHWGEDHKFYLIPWESSGSNVESYLQQMSRWIQQAVDENATFEMELPTEKIPPGSGYEQARLCWRALAGYRSSL